jgi:dTDP-glucose 4,6-dehydratase
MVLNALHGDKLPVYGDGMQVRNWLYVEDFARGIGTCSSTACRRGLQRRRPDETYNLDVVKKIIELTGADESLIDYVTDRPGHDRRYSLGSEKVRALGLGGAGRLRRGPAAHRRLVPRQPAWWEPIRSGDYRAYYERQYGTALG